MCIHCQILGKGGSKISDLQFESGAKIHVTKDQEDDQTFINLSGTTEEIQKAEELINQLTIDRPRNTIKLVEDPNYQSEEIEPIDWQSVFDECVSVLF